jgi:hypothetical protein
VIPIHPRLVVIPALAATLCLAGCDVPPWEADRVAEIRNNTDQDLELLRIDQEDGQILQTFSLPAGSPTAVPISGDCDPAVWELRLLDGTVAEHFDQLCVSDEIVIDPEDLPE